MRARVGALAGQSPRGAPPRPAGSGPGRLRAALAALLAVLAAGLAGCGDGRVPPEGAGPGVRPDVVLVVIDTLRADRTGLLPRGAGRTPELMRLAASGTCFPVAIAPAAWTLPSMAALFAGQDVSVNRHSALAHEPSLAERFAAAGWHTRALVANPLLTADNGFARGFERFEVAPAHSTNDLQGDLSQLRAWDASALVSRVRDGFLDGPHDAPLFLYLHLMDPHVPYDPAHAGLATPQPGWSAPGPDGRFEAFVEQPDPAQAERLQGWRLGYDGQVAFADAALGRLLDLLDLVRPRPRLVAVVADHGEGLFDHARAASLAPREGPLGEGYADHGEQVHEEAVRVPLVLAGPGVPRGRRETRPVATRDLGATLLGLAGCGVGAMRRLPLRDEDPSPPVVFGLSTRSVFARTAGRKRLLPTESSGAPAADGGAARAGALWAVAGEAYLPERTDLSPAEGAVSEGLRSLLEAWREAGRERTPADSGPDPATLERLRQLGYVR